MLTCTNDAATYRSFLTMDDVCKSSTDDQAIVTDVAMIRDDDNETATVFMHVLPPGCLNVIKRWFTVVYCGREVTNQYGCPMWLGFSSALERAREITGK